MTEPTDQEKLEYLVAVKASLRNSQRLRTWGDKVQSIARMNAASKRAKAGMALVMSSSNEPLDKNAKG